MHSCHMDKETRASKAALSGCPTGHSGSKASKQEASEEEDMADWAGPWRGIEEEEDGELPGSEPQRLSGGGGRNRGSRIGGEQNAPPDPHWGSCEEEGQRLP